MKLIGINCSNEEKLKSQVEALLKSHRAYVKLLGSLSLRGIVLPTEAQELIDSTTTEITKNYSEAFPHPKLSQD